MLATQLKKRRYDLDWLRIILILLVFLHHVGMPFNGDDWHIINAEKSKLLDDIMVFFEQWRLPLLFLISGAGTMLATSKRNSFEYLKERSKRLLIPLIFGVCVIVPPQIYFQYITEFKSYMGLYPMVFTRLEANHLWFIEKLFIFSVFALPLILFLRSKHSVPLITRIERFTQHSVGFFLVVLPLILITIYLNEMPEESSKEVLSHVKYLFYFFMGMIIASSDQLWENIKQHRKTNMTLFLISMILFYVYYFIPSKMVSFISLENRWNLWYIVCHFVGWSLSLTILGYGQMYFSKSHKWLKPMNEAIYPFYILHQTVIIVIGYEVIQWDASIVSKLMFILIVSFVIIVVIYRWCIYPFNWIRPLFGMKKR